MSLVLPFFFFFFNDTATTEIYTLSLHDALPICRECVLKDARGAKPGLSAREKSVMTFLGSVSRRAGDTRSEEHTSELQSRLHLVCRLLLEKKKKKKNTTNRDIHKNQTYVSLINT